MPAPPDALEERPPKAGIAPPHVRRHLRELRERLAWLARMQCTARTR